MNAKQRSLLEHLDSALRRLQDVLAQPASEYMRDSAIQRFEFTFELFWKCLKADGEASGAQGFSPRDCLRNAFQMGVIQEDARWFRMLEDRNLTSHTYNEATAEAIHSRLSSHLAMMTAVAAMLKARAARD